MDTFIFYLNKVIFTILFHILLNNDSIAWLFFSPSQQHNVSIFCFVASANSRHLSSRKFQSESNYTCSSIHNLTSPKVACNWATTFKHEDMNLTCFWNRIYALIIYTIRASQKRKLYPVPNIAYARIEILKFAIKGVSWRLTQKCAQRKILILRHIPYTLGRKMHLRYFREHIACDRWHKKSIFGKIYIIFMQDRNILFSIEIIILKTTI